MMRSSQPGPYGLYDPRFEHDACGVSFVVDIKGRASRRIVELAMGALCNLEHRGATGAEPDTGDGAGILLQIPDRFLRGVTGGTVRASTRPIHVGRRTIVVQTELRDDAGKLVALTTQTQAVLT